MLTSHIKILLVALCVTIIGGCAHPIAIAPDFNAVQAPATQVTAKKAAYYISDEDRAREVTTPGGGGDKVRYFPYRDLEAGLYKVLSATFASIAKLNKAPENEELNRQGIVVVVTPRITTHSSSDSIVTWPPTSFTVELECRISDPTGTELAQARIVGFGNASFDEFKSDFALAGKRASADALNKLANTLATLDAVKD